MLHVNLYGFSPLGVGPVAGEKYSERIQCTPHHHGEGAHIWDLIGRAIDAAVQAGADEVQSITFSSSRYEALRQQALAVAVGNARRDAEIMARAAGGRLGQLIEVSVSQPVYGGRHGHGHHGNEVCSRCASSD